MGTDGAVLDGGGAGTLIRLRTNGASLTVEDLTLTGGLACFGSVVLAADMAEDCSPGAGNLDTAITMRRVDITGNAYETGGGTIGVVGGSVTLEDTRIADNQGHGVFAVDADVSCSGSTGMDAGLHDNSKSGVWMMPTVDARTLTSSVCDWGNNAQEDVRIGEELSFDGFGEDASFSCDSLAGTCG